MNWIERMYELKGKDLYSQNGEGLLLEYALHYCNVGCYGKSFIDIGAGDGFNLSNTRHLINLGYKGKQVDKINGEFVTAENVSKFYDGAALISIDTDGNDYWILDKMITIAKPFVIIAEFNPAFTDSRTIEYNPNHVWQGDDYYGFSFEAAKKLAEKHDYKIIYNIANMNLIIVEKDAVEGLIIPPVTYEQNDYFKKSERTDWVWI